MLRILKIIRNIVLILFISSICAVLLYRFVPVYFTPLMAIRCIEQVKDGKTLKLRHRWVSIDRMSQHLPIAVMSSEDQNFELHHGFDIDAIRDAIEERSTRGRKRGASTISQQTAKNVFLWPSKSWIRKGLEVYFTALIELAWGKERIMEVYLNSIEMGDGIYGAEAVAEVNFHCSASSLSRQQCALIAATLPNPRRFSSAKPSGYMLKRQGQILGQMRNFISFPMSEKEKEQRREYIRRHSKKRK